MFILREIKDLFYQIKNLKFSQYIEEIIKYFLDKKYKLLNKPLNLNFVYAR